MPILQAAAYEHHWEGEGPLSIKMFWGGQAHYQVGKARFAVDDASYLVLNHGQTYSIDIESEHKVASFCVFFAAGDAEAVHSTLTTPLDSLLHDPEHAPTNGLDFFERTYTHDDLVSPAMVHLKAVAATGVPERAWIDEQFQFILQRLLQAQQRIVGEVDALPAARRSTREELYRRLHRVRDYILATSGEQCTLEHLAHIAELSPNHLLRTFKQAFHQTPYQFVLAVRLRHARKLLVETDLPITHICFAVGFESPGSFSWLFRQRNGCSPEAFRNRSRNG